MAKSVSISVIVPVYNAQTTLNRCVDSILASAEKTEACVQIILINDGSADRSQAICEEYARQHAGILFIQQTNRGVSAARNAGLRAATGDYILFVDSDDCVTPNCFQTVEGSLVQYPSDYYLYSFIEVHGQNRKEIKRKERCLHDRRKIYKEVEKLIATKAINPPWAKVFKREIMEENGLSFLPGISIGEDKAFNYAYSMCIQSMFISDQPVYEVYLDNSDSLSRKKRDDIQEQFQQANVFIQKRLTSSNLSQAEKERYERAFGFLAYSAVYSHAKQMIRDGIEKKERHRLLQNDMRELSVKKTPFPFTMYCICFVLPVRLRMAWLIDFCMRWIYKK